MIFGLLACITYNYYPSEGMQIHPWDGPELLIFTVGLWLFLKQNAIALAILTILGIGFKETTLVLALFIPFISGEKI